MKIKFLIIAIAVSTVLTSCQKEILDKTEDSVIQVSPLYEGVTFRNDVIEFESIENYEKLVDGDDYDEIKKLAEYLNRINTSSYKNNTKNNVLDDELMEVLFNKDLVVKIGDWLIKILPEKELLFVISSKETKAYQKLLSGNDSQIKAFQTSDDVIESLKYSKIQTGLFCKESGVAARQRGASYRKSNGNKIEPTLFNQARLRHDKFGIYFRLLAIAETASEDDYDRKVFFAFTRKTYKKRCKSQFNGLITVHWSPFINNTWKNKWGHGNYYHYDDYKYVISSGTTNYHKYRIEMRAGIVDVIDGKWVYSGTTNSFDIRANL